MRRMEDPETLAAIRIALDLGDEPWPLWWTADFINAAPVSQEAPEWTLCEFNCSCVGVGQFWVTCCANTDNPNAGPELLSKK
mmetsp:Transcript_15774/g.19826  ORF Transcript_15774/g.19826 Transcript_15774/m.19826 type:complete len:82 (+) Transcript_15774:271-516(+)